MARYSGRYGFHTLTETTILMEGDTRGDPSNLGTGTVGLVCAHSKPTNSLAPLVAFAAHCTGRLGLFATPPACRPVPSPGLYY
jgi:hypothetical protein